MFLLYKLACNFATTSDFPVCSSLLCGSAFKSRGVWDPRVPGPRDHRVLHERHSCGIWYSCGHVSFQRPFLFRIHWLKTSVTCFIVFTRPLTLQGLFCSHAVHNLLQLVTLQTFPRGIGELQHPLKRPCLAHGLSLQMEFRCHYVHSAGGLSSFLAPETDADAAHDPGWEVWLLLSRMGGSLGHRQGLGTLFTRKEDLFFFLMSFCSWGGLL